MSVFPTNVMRVAADEPGGLISPDLLGPEGKMSMPEMTRLALNPATPEQVPIPYTCMSSYVHGWANVQCAIVYSLHA